MWWHDECLIDGKSVTQCVLCRSGQAKQKKTQVVLLPTMEELNAPKDEPTVGREATAGPVTMEVMPEEVTDVDTVGIPPVMVPPPSLEELIWMGVQEVCQLQKGTRILSTEFFRRCRGWWH